ncbi:filamentation induced by cAMP protein Fic [Gloeobacter kilaueensis JS1]|uniref:Filamentation induced by cAMP protein Fic n=1 Tax=Gloeobacter kilaueensis (strain ATCC BAA-2537 / CCAP 1431/1 / ULC 316 / JS1) TaxID=1183438 RepID=U5QKS2_GLOK1|nr:filamentation induced by cAMP protein Fic [Gloeobacter kilaueensis JS1]
MNIIRAHTDGIGVDTLRQKVALTNLNWSERTLNRRLSELTTKGRLRREGRARATKYFASELQPASRLEVEVQVPVSPEAEQIRALVRRPLIERRPVGYNRKFLDAYRPNETAYLSVALRRQLHKLGKSPDADRPVGTYARHILNRLLIDLSWNSSRLEGNTYSRLDTERLLEEGLVAEGKAAQETQMILNHKDAIELLVDNAEEVDFNSYTIRNLHAQLANNLLGDQAAGGRLRRIPVGISGTVYEPLAIPQLIEECFEQILQTARVISDPFEQAFFVMVHLPYLQPFEDVNKRVSRLAANIPLIKGNLCPLSFTEVPEQSYIEGILGIYELNRIELMRDVFVWAYERSCARYLAVRHSLGEPDRFRMRYRQQVSEAVRHVVREKLDREAAEQFTLQFASAPFEADERDRLVETILDELESLHLGNITRYRLSPSDYESWHVRWKA